MNRRTFLTSCLGVAWATSAEPAIAESSLGVRDLAVATESGGARRARLLLPVNAPAPSRVLVLLHGRGETHDPDLGLRAWPELYGAAVADARLRRPPLFPESVTRRYTSLRLAEQLEREARAQPYHGLALLCPVTPNPSSGASREQVFREFTAWLEHGLLPRVRKEVPGIRHVGIDGCSMGGLVSLEVFLRAPHLFGSVGTVQGAYGAFRVPGFVERFQAAFRKAGTRPVHIESSSGDDFRDANRALSRQLSERGIANDLEIPHGPHNQPWLREVGTLLMLRWHDRNLPR